MTLAKTKEQVIRIIGKGGDKVGQGITMTPRTRSIIEKAKKEAEALQSSHISSEHILLAIVEDVEGVATRILWNLDVDLDQLRNHIQAGIGE